MDSNCEQKKGRILISIVLAALCISTVLPPFWRIVDPINSGALFTISFIALAAIWLAMPKSFTGSFRWDFNDFIVLFFVIFPLFRADNDDLWLVGLQILGLLYFALRLTADGIRFRIIYTGVILAALLLEAHGALQLLGWLPRSSSLYAITGPYYNSAIYASMLSLLLGIAITPWVLDKTIKTNQWIGTAVVLVFLSGVALLILSGARTSWIALGGILIWLGWVKWKSQHRRNRLRIRSWHLLAAVSLTILLGFSLYQLKPQSAQGRLLIWKVSCEMIKDKPIFGFGYQGFESNYMHYQQAYLKEHASDEEKLLAGNNQLIYNTPFRLWINYGIAGMLPYVILFYRCVVRNRRTDIVSSTCKAVLIAYFIQGMFFYPDKVFPIQLLLVLALAFLTDHSSDAAKDTPRPLSRNIIAGCALMACIFLTYTLSVRLKSFRDGYSLMTAPQRLSEKEVIDGLRRIQPMMRGNVGFTASYCSYLNRIGNDSLLLEELKNWEKAFPVNELYIMRGDLLRRQGDLTGAEAGYRYAHYMVPSRQRARSRLAYLYQEMGDSCRARRLAEEILTEKVKVYGFATYEIHRELRRTFGIE